MMMMMMMMPHNINKLKCLKTITLEIDDFNWYSLLLDL